MKNQNKTPEKQMNEAVTKRVPMSQIITVMALMFIMLITGIPVCSVAATEPEQQRTDVPSPVIGTDPFLPFIEPPREERPDVGAAGVVGATLSEKPAFRTPLQLLTTQEIRLLGIVIGGDRRLAVVQDGRGIVHDLSEGTAVGMSDGRVLEILQDRVIIEETVRDPSGEQQRRQTVLRIE